MIITENYPPTIWTHETKYFVYWTSNRWDTQQQIAFLSRLSMQLKLSSGWTIQKNSSLPDFHTFDKVNRTNDPKPATKTAMNETVSYTS